MVSEAPLSQKLGSLQEEAPPPPSLSKTNSRSQEQMCLLADTETPFKVPGLNPS